MHARFIAGLIASVFAAGAAAQEPPPRGEPVRSMGFPAKWKPHAGLVYHLDRSGDEASHGAEGHLGLYRDLLNPNLAALGLTAEAYGGFAGEEGTGGIRLYGSLPFFMVHLGADHSFPQEATDFILTLRVPPVRGGLFGRGGDIRIDWLPWRGNTINVGVTFPILQPYAGRSRPKRAHAVLPDAPRSKEADAGQVRDLEQRLDAIARAAGMIRIYGAPFLDTHLDLEGKEAVRVTGEIEEFREYVRSRDADYPDGHTLAGEAAFYHREIEALFSEIAGDGSPDPVLGARLAGAYREILLEEVILPHNRLLGQRKKDERILGLAAGARRRFVDRAKEAGLDPGRREAAAALYDRLVGIVEKNRKTLKKDWEDSRFVWIPMNYALRLEDHDSQAEIDAILEKALGREFAGGNETSYVLNEQFQWELARMIHAARDYHVLWIHDFRGLNNGGDPDRIGYHITADGYLRAMIDRVREYDETGTMPVWTIILDQFYFVPGKAELYLRMLEDPLGRGIDLPVAFSSWQARIDSLRAELSAAVEGSARMRAGRERYGDDWVRNLVKVHINITNPPDMSFRSGNMFKYLFFVPDILFRDHRKISFYDITEEDPGRGEALYTGMGVGEHYASPTWDDRAILVRGPAVLSLKAAARDVLLSQGFRDEDVPVPLRPLPMPADYADKVARLQAAGWITTAMEVHNRTGFAQKDDNVVKAILYTLMPAGSHLYIPDSLWNSALWGSMLFGASLRGCHVYVITPSLENAPSDGMPQMMRAHELFSRFLFLRDRGGDLIEESGGDFRIGVYTYDGDVQDQVARIDAILGAVERYPWLREALPFGQSVFDGFTRMRDDLIAEGYRAEHISRDVEPRKPKLHFKAQLFGTGEGVNSLLPLEGWDELFRNTVALRAEQTSSRDKYFDQKEFRRRLEKSILELADQWRVSLSPGERERIAFYLTVGSQNEDYRGMVMDGEVLVVVSGPRAALAYLDFVQTIMSTTWVEEQEELDRLLPPFGGFWYGASRYIRLAL